MLSVKVDFLSFFQKGVKKINEDFAIRLICGYQGSGKTYVALYMVLNQHKGKLIKTNIKSFKSEFNCVKYFEKLEEILEDEEMGCVYVIDELSKKYNKDSKIDKPFYSWLQQSRKHNRYVYLITQEYINVPIWLRGIATLVYTTSKLPLLPIFKTNLGVPYLNENYEWDISTTSTIIYKRTKFISSHYDTRESIPIL